MRPLRRCGASRVGHDMHFIQWRLSRADGPGEERVIASVADDGVITFTHGAPVWNHDPERLRAVIEERGPAATLGAHGVLSMPSDDGWYCFSVCAEPDPCRDDTAEDRPGESLAEELLRRGGFLRRADSLLDKPE